MTFSRVIAATDFSAASEAALKAAARWSERLEIPLVVVHVYDPAPLGPSAASPLPTWPTEAGKRAIHHNATKQLELLREGLLEGVAFEGVTTEHPRPALGLCHFAEEDDLLILGTHGRTGVQRVLMGSVAEQTVRHAPCAVLVMRGGTDVDTFPSNMTVCTDFSTASVPAVVAGGTVARAFEAPATLLYVEDTDAWQRATEDLADDEGLLALEESMNRAMAELYEEHLPGPVKTQLVVSDHRPEGIVEHAKSRGVDLLVLATHGRSGLARLVIGSVTERVVRMAPCPVLVVRSGSADDSQK